jgi:hypothetical protein
LHGCFQAGASLSLRVWPNHFIRTTAIPCSSLWGIAKSVVTLSTDCHFYWHFGSVLQKMAQSI